MIKAIIIDDESNNREKLRNLINRNCPEIEVIGEANGVRSGISAIRSKNPDLIFLDIRMDDGSGFDLLNRFNSIDFKVIFVTAFEEFALKAFRFSASDYLLKPVDSEELTEAVKKVTRQLANQHQKQLDMLSESVHSGQFKKLALRDAENIYLVNVGDLIHCKSDGNYVHFTVNGENDIVVSKQLKEYDEILTEFGFFRPHKSYLINMAHAKRFEKSDGGYVVMSDNSKIPVSSRKREQLLAIFEQF